MKKILVGLVFVAGLTNQAYAWGDREQGLLTGIAAGVLLNQSYNAPRVYQPPVIYQPTTVYIVPPVIYNYNMPPVMRPIYSHQIVYDPVCQCHRQVEVQTGWAY